MIKVIRHILGGTWYKIKSVDAQREFWIRPSRPDATEKLSARMIMKKEQYSHCLFHNQCMTPI